jgi:hypothetical protein
MPLKIDFLDLLIEPEKIVLYFKALSNSFSMRPIYNNPSPKPLNFEHQSYIFKDIPEYIKPSFHNRRQNFSHKKINTYQGSKIDIAKYSNFSAYFNHRFNSKKRSQLKTYKKRLETCFNISYKVYYGNITQNDYNILFNTLPQLLKKRFDAKETKHYALGMWDFFQKNAFSLINEKKACMFVIYEREKPISISFNPILGKIAFGYLKGFDTDYSKFYLGFIDLVWQIEWYFLENFDSFDLLKGAYSYKAKFADSHYFFQNHFVDNSNSWNQSIMIKAIFLRTKLFYACIHFLKKIKIDQVFHGALHRSLKVKSKLMEKKSHLTIRTDEFTFFTMEGLIKINLYDENYAFLKKPSYDFMYSSQTNINELEIFKMTEEASVFILKGVQKSVKITFITNAC